MVQRDIQNRIREHPDSGKRSVSRKIRFRAGNVFVSQWQSADFSQLRGHGEEIGKRIVPGRDPASVRVVQITPEDQRIRVVSRFVFHQHDLADNGGIHGKHAAAFIPHDQVIAVQKVTHIDIRGGIAPHVGKKLAAHRRRVADHQTVFSRSGRHCSNLAQEQHKGCQNSSESLHWSLLSLHSSGSQRREIFLALRVPARSAEKVTPDNRRYRYGSGRIPAVRPHHG